jgi:hypothetical protein
MKNGISRFNYYLDQLQALLDKAAKQKNPALWLYQNNARTPLFMLEGLAKLYAGVHNKKKFGKIKEQFKLLEDIFGAVDYYDAFAKQFAQDKKIPATIVSYLQAQAREKIQSANEILIEKEWLAAENRRMRKIKQTLNDVKWLKDKAEIKKINEFYGTAIYEIVEFVSPSKFHFKNVEADVHELRRKLRWLSIYPQAFRGCIQYSKAKTSPRHMAKYLTKEITGSPYNVMPDAGDNRYFLLLEKNYFYALSWMIAELGRLKDSGLSVIAVKEALLQTTPVTEAIAFKNAYKILGNKQPQIKTILDKADAVAKTYFNEHNLEHLVIGTAAVRE